MERIDRNSPYIKRQGDGPWVVWTVALEEGRGRMLKKYDITYNYDDACASLKEATEQYRREHGKSGE